MTARSSRTRRSRDPISAGHHGRNVPHLTRHKTPEPLRLHAGLDKLKTEDRETLEAFYLKGRSLKQMAREFDAPVGTIKRRLHVARNRLRNAMENSTARRKKVTV